MRNFVPAILVSLVLFQNLKAQPGLFDNDPEAQKIINRYFYWESDEEPAKPFSALNEEEKLNLFCEMIERPYDKEEAYFKLFDWFLEEFPESSFAKAKMPPLELALTSGEEIPAKLLIEHAGKIPQKILVEHECDFVPVSSLYMASETEDFNLIKKMIDYGIEADSFCYQYWLEYAENPKSFIFFSKYNDTTYYDEDGKNILDHILRNTDDDHFFMDIPMVKAHEDDYTHLIEKIMVNDNEGITELYDRFMPMHLEHEARKQKIYYNQGDYRDENWPAYSYSSDKLRTLFYLSVFLGNIPVLDKLVDLKPFELSHILLDDHMPLYLSSDFQNWLQEKEMLPYIQMDLPYSENDFFPVFLTANNFSVKNNGNTRKFLLNGGNTETLATYYASEKTNSPAIFESIARGDKNAMVQYLESNKNPFMTDKYGLTLFELLAFTGMESAVVKICDENKYLPLERESLALALLGHNKKILSTLAKKVPLNEHSTYLYHTAIAAGDKEALQWLLSNNYSAEGCLADSDYAYKIFRVLENKDVLKLLLKAGLKNQVWEDSRGAFIFRTEARLKDEITLLEFAIGNHYDEAAELMYPYFYPGKNKPGINLLTIAAYSGTPEMTEFLIKKGLSPNETDTTLDGVTPIEMAVYMGNTEIVKKMVDMGADYTITPMDILESKIDGKDENHTLADVSGSLSTLEYLQTRGCVFTTYLEEQIESDIRCWKDEKVKELLRKYPYFSAENYFNKVLHSNNEKLGIWFLQNYEIPVLQYCSDAFYNNNKWFFEYCLGDPSLRNSLLQYRDENKNTLLHMSLTKENVQQAELFLENGFDPNTPNEKGYSSYYLLLQARSFKGREELLSLMKAHGATDNFNQEVINNGFLDALREKDLGKMKQFLEMGADPNQETSMQLGYYWNSQADTVPAIYTAIASGSPSLAEILLLYGADPNAKNEKYESPLLMALNKSDYNTARMLIYKGANVNFVPKNKKNNKCEEQEPLIDWINRLYPGLDLYEKSSPDVLNIDTLLARAVRENNIKKLDELFTKIEQEQYSFWADGFEYLLVKEGSLNMINHVMDKKYVDFTKERLLFLRRAVENKRLDLIKSLPNTFYSEIDLAQVKYDDPILKAVLLGKRLFSFYTVNETIDPGKYEVPDTSQRTRGVALEIIKHLATHVKNYNDSIYISRALNGRFYEAAAYFFDNPEKMTNERKALANIINHNNEALEKQLHEGLSPDAGIYDFRLITCAAWANNTEAAMLLLDDGADITFSNINLDKEGQWIQACYRPVMWSLMLGNQELTISLTNKGADLNYISFRDNMYGSNALTMLMVQEDKRAFFKQLLDDKVIHYSTGNNAFTLLTQAISFDDPDLVQLLLKYPPEEIYYSDFKNVPYYAPTNLEGCISYAVENESPKVFFSLVKNMDVNELSIKEYAIRSCDDTSILKWLLDKEYKIENKETYRMILEKAIKNNDNELFFRVYKIMEDTFSESPLKDEHGFRNIVNNIFQHNNIDIFKFLMDKGLPYKDDYLVKAVKEDNTDFIKYFITDLGVDWLDRGSYRVKFIPDNSKTYKTWEFTTQLIEFSLGESFR